MIKLFTQLLVLSKKVRKKILMNLYKKLFKKVGKNFIFDPFDRFSYETISIGDNVFIGSGACLAASDSAIFIGNKVMFGPNVTIMGGDHRMDVIGKYMFDVKEKTEETDKPVFIEDDTWIGSGAIILKGVTIAKGSIVAAGSLVLKSCEPYSIIGGVPAKILKKRFTEEQIIEHEKKLNRDK